MRISRIASGAAQAIEVSWYETDIAVVTLRGEHDLGTSAELAKELRSLVRVGEHVIVDLSEVDFIDSSVLHNLVAADRMARDRGLTFTLQAATSPIVQKTLEITGLLERLQCASSREDAIRTARNGNGGNVLHRAS
jgi:anti-anti-sigma factor